jgi:hypothetical protein
MDCLGQTSGYMLVIWSLTIKKNLFYSVTHPSYVIHEPGNLIHFWHSSSYSLSCKKWHWISDCHILLPSVSFKTDQLCFGKFTKKDWSFRKFIPEENLVQLTQIPEARETSKASTRDRGDRAECKLILPAGSLWVSKASDGVTGANSD